MPRRRHPPHLTLLAASSAPAPTPRTEPLWQSALIASAWRLTAVWTAWLVVNGARVLALSDGWPWTYYGALWLSVTLGIVVGRQAPRLGPAGRRTRRSDLADGRGQPRAH